MASEIEDAITEMLHESTGVAICDSGGSCGRHWQKNQLIEDFGKLPRFSYTICQLPTTEVVGLRLGPR